MHGRQRARRIRPQLRELRFEDVPAGGVLVAQIDPDLSHAGAPRGDQHSLEEAVRIALEIPAVLEGAGLALVDVHRHDARLGLGADQPPFATGREPCAAQPAQPGILHQLRDLVARALAREAVLQQAIAAAFAIRFIADRPRRLRPGRAALHGILHRIGRRVADGVLPHHHAGRDFAAPHARRGNHPYVLAKIHLEERLRAGELAGDRVAYANRQLRRRFFPFLHHLEMMVEGRHFVDLGEGERHLLRERRERRGRQVAVVVVQAVQVLDQQVAAAGRIAEQAPYLLQRLGVDRPAFGNRPGFRFHADRYYRAAALAGFLTAVKPS
jgi:hypothetical protein